MTESKPNVLVVEVAALGWNLLERYADDAWVQRHGFRPAETVFPAVTCPVQASVRTGLAPEDHGILGNGFYARKLHRTFFWEQSADLVHGPRIWEGARMGGRRTGLLFWQQSLGEAVDLVLSPKPVHKHHGGMIQDVYSKPAGLYGRMIDRIGRPFNLRHYWGPLASHRSSDWIVEATISVMRDSDAPAILFSYLPHLDYALQRDGPESPAARKAFAVTTRYLDRLRAAAEAAGYRPVFFGDYAMAPVTAAPVYPNRLLRDAGLLAVRTIRGMAYPDYFSTGALAVVDHEVALVYVLDPGRLEQAAALFENDPGVAEVLRTGRADRPDEPDLVLTAASGRWFAYPWWTKKAEAPDYAGHVDIHNKPGFDPAELFFGFPPPGISLDAGRVRGTHGRAGPERRVAISGPVPGAETPPATVLELSIQLKTAMGAA